MKYAYYITNEISKSKYIILLLIITANSFFTSFAEETGGPCINCFSTELISMEQVDECITIELEVNASNCNYALSHFTAEVPCGTITEASNSENWKMILNSTDPTTGVSGIKVDDISNFGEDGFIGTFRLSYTVCSGNTDCLNLIQNEDFRVAYKAANCLFIDTIEVVNNKLEAHLQPQNPKCYNANDGSINTVITQGTPPYTFQWSTGATTKDLLQIGAGLYELIINDANGSSITLSAELTQSTQIVTNANITNTNCNANDGAIQTNTTGGIAPYTYHWSNGATSSDIDQLESGTYTLIVTDAQGCSNSNSYTVKKTSSLRATVTSDVLECYEDGTGELTVTVSGGTEPYTYLWSNGDTTQTSKNLNSGSHKVLIRDAEGCELEKSGYVIIQRISVTASTTQPICNGESTGSSTLSISEGTEPYDVVWSTGDTTLTVENLSVGWYYADVTDSMGCSFRKYVQIKEPTEIKLQASFNRMSCNEADSLIEINLSASGGTSPYIYYYNNQETENRIEVEKEGYYTFTAIDANGCEKTDSFLVTRNKAELESTITTLQPDCQQAEFGSVSVSVSSGTAPYVYYWSDGVSTANRTDLTAGTYTLEISDSKNCSAIHEITINEILIPTLTLSLQDESTLCNSTGNLINAETNNVISTEWIIESINNDWQYEEAYTDYALFTAGTEQVTFIAKGTSTDGCISYDTLSISCNSGDIENPTDPIDPKGDCEVCYTWEDLKIISLDNGCYQYSATIKTDGSCRYDLSHLTVQLNNGQVSNLHNSKNWKFESNSTDPTTGIYGFKIDDIENFGTQGSDQFELNFTICSNNEAQQSFIVAYKSAQCVAIDTIYFNANLEDEIIVKSYPNPFVDEAHIEFIPSSSEYLELNIYDVQGTLLEQVFKGNVEKGVSYQFTFSPTQSSSNIFFYHLIHGDEITQGKLLQVK